MDIQEIQEKFEDLLLANPDFDESLLEKDEEGSYADSDIQHMYSMFEAGTEVGEQQQAAKAQAVSEGFVLVEKEKIKTWYQDDEEPENFCYGENGFDDLADHIDSDYILQINKIEDCIVSTTPKFGVWKTEYIDQSGDIHKHFVLADTREDAEKVIQSNRAIDKAWGEAQEQKG